MNRADAFTARTLDCLARSWRAAWFIVLGTLLFAIGTQPARETRAVDFQYYYDDAAGQGFWDPALGPARRAALEAAGEIWGRLIVPSYEGETISVRAQFDSYPPGSNTLAAASPNYLYSDFGSPSPQYQSDTNYPKALANHLAGRESAPERSEINVSVNMNPTTPFYYGLDGMPPLGLGQRDFVTVALHELGHGLGFYDSFRDDGEFGLLGDKSFHPFCTECLPTPYDTFLSLGPSGPTLISLDGDGRESAVTSNNVFWNGANGIAGYGGAAPKIHAPASWSDGSSISHLDATTFPMDLMRPGYYGVDQSPSAFERGILRDMGWTIAVGATPVSWTGLGPNNNATTAANWSPALPLPGDSLAFDQSPITDVQMDLLLGTIQGISFPAAAPAYTLRFKSRVDMDLTGSGIINSSSNPQTVFLESSSRDDLTWNFDAATLTFTGPAGMAGANAGNADYHLRGGDTRIICPPMSSCYFERNPGASISFENNSTAGTASFEIEGGSGDGGPNAQVTFRQNSSAAAAEFRTKGGRYGPTLPVGFIAGFSGQVRFEDNSKAGLATFHNEGQAEYFNGAGGFTVFTDTSTAQNAEIHNHGATNIGGIGGATFFYDSSTAGAASITNHSDGANHVNDIAARTVFQDTSNAGTATIENVGASSQSVRPGRTEFRNFSSAASATINNRGHITVGDLAGRTLFYDNATAAGATLRTFDGYSDHGRIEFRNQSTAASAKIFIENEPMNTATAGGYLNFFDNSTAAASEITLRAGTQGTVQFYNNATAANAQIITETGVGNPGNIFFNDNSTAANANISLGESSVMTFYGQSTAANATIAMASRAKIDFQGTSAGQAQIIAAGGSTNTGGVQAFVNFLGASATAANSTITVNGASATLASPAAVHITGTASPGNATLIANGGTNGGAGGTILFNGAANGSTAQIIANAGSLVDFFSQVIYNDISFGSIEGAGTFWLRGAHVITGNRNTSTTVSGPIIEHPFSAVTGGRLTKVGAGTLTLAGTNTYTGLTTVNAGTVSVTGSIAGGAVVNNGGTLNGTGTIGGGVTVNTGGVFAPGTSPGTIAIDGLAMMPDGMLNFELGDSASDHIILTNNGNVSLDGILNISLLDGFTPDLGQSFSLFEGAIGSITGAFDWIIAPTFNGLTFDIIQSANSLLLQVGEAPFLAGDYNGNDAVDAADYTLWRNNLGGTALVNRSSGVTGPIGAADYSIWKANFGETFGGGSGSTGFASESAAVPEPGLFTLAAGGLLSLSAIARRRRHRWPKPLREFWPPLSKSREKHAIR